MSVFVAVGLVGGAHREVLDHLLILGRDHLDYLLRGLWLSGGPDHIRDLGNASQSASRRPQ